MPAIQQLMPNSVQTGTVTSAGQAEPRQDIQIMFSNYMRQSTYQESAYSMQMPGQQAADTAGTIKMQGSGSAVQDYAQCQSKAAAQAEKISAVDVSDQSACSMSAEAQKAVEDAVQAVKDIIKEELGIEDEQLEDAMELLGLTQADLFYPQQLAALTAELTGEDAGMMLFSESFQNILQQGTAIMQDLLQDLGMTMEQLTEQLNLMAQTGQNVQNEAQIGIENAIGNTYADENEYQNSEIYVDEAKTADQTEPEMKKEVSDAAQPLRAERADVEIPDTLQEQPAVQTDTDAPDMMQMQAQPAVQTDTDAPDMMQMQAQPDMQPAVQTDADTPDMMQMQAQPDMQPAVQTDADAPDMMQMQAQPDMQPAVQTDADTPDMMQMQMQAQPAVQTDADTPDISQAQTAESTEMTETMQTPEASQQMRRSEEKVPMQNQQEPDAVSNKQMQAQPQEETAQEQPQERMKQAQAVQPEAYTQAEGDGTGSSDSTDAQTGGRNAQQEGSTRFQFHTEARHGQRFEAPITNSAANQPQAPQVNVENIIRQIAEYTRLHLTESIKSIEMQLNPANLGKIYLHVTEKAGAVTAQITAQDEQVKEALLQQADVLRDNLSQQGIRVNAVEVSVGTHEFESNLEEGARQQEEQARQQQEQQERHSRRGINLNDPDYLDGISGLMSEEEELVARIMRDNGNNVDFKA